MSQQSPTTQFTTPAASTDSAGVEGCFGEPRHQGGGG